MKKQLVAYFSASGNTAQVAKRLAHAIGADLFEIRPQTPYTPADLNWTDRESRTSVEMRDPAFRPPIVGDVPDVGDYKIIFLGFPVWWYREPTIIDTFLEACAFSGQIVVPFATSGGSEIGSEAPQNIQAVAPLALVKEGKRFPVEVSEKDLADWAQQF